MKHAFPCLVIAVTSALLVPRSEELHFGGPEIFPLDARMHGLQAADLDGDGRTDALLINNARSSIQLLLNRPGGEADGSPGSDINDLPPDARFRLDSIHCEERISGLVVVDFTGEESPDILYCADQDEIVLLENRGDGHWPRTHRWPVPDVVPGSPALGTGDFDGDGATELAVLSESAFTIIRRPDSREKSTPLPHGGGLDAFHVSDVDGDGCDDILALSPGDAETLYLFWGGTGGISSSQQKVKLGAFRFLLPCKMSEDGPDGLVTISRQSGRAVVHQWKRLPLSLQDGEAGWQRIGLPRSRLQERGLDGHDLDGDGDTDLIVADHDAGKLLVHEQDASGRFLPPSDYAAPTGIDELQVHGQAGIVLFSREEELVGITSWSLRGGIPFPVPPSRTEGRPIGFTAGSLDGGHERRILVLGRNGTQPDSLFLSANPPGDIREVSLKTSGESSTRDPRYRPDRVRLHLHDVDQDGLIDIVALAPHHPMLLLRRTASDGPLETVVFYRSGRSAASDWAGTLDMDGDGIEELVLPLGNAIRGVRAIKGPDGWSLRVEAQINGADSRSVITGLARLEDGRICLLDSGMNLISFLERDAGDQWRIAVNLPLPRNGLQRLEPARIGPGAGPALLLSGGDHAYLLPLEGDSWRPETVATFVSGLEDAHLRSCLVADLDGKGRPELVFLETRRHNLEIVALEEDRSMTSLVRWPVFEARTYRPPRQGLPEPREVVARDFTGDGRTDLMLLVHDRVLLYPRLVENPEPPF